MKIVLIVPDRPYLLNQKALPPLGVLYVSAALKQARHDVTVLDYADCYKLVEADVYGVSVTSSDVLQAVNILKFLKVNGAERVICGGNHATLMPEECLSYGFDGVFVGDGELLDETLLLSEGQVAEGWLRNLDDAPHPDRTALNLHDYHFQVNGVDATSLMTARGCIWGECAFCSRTGRGVRFHSAGYVIKELKEIKKLGFNAIAIYDDEFFVNPIRDLKIIEALGELGFTWRCFAKSNYVIQHSDLIELAGRNGLVEVLLGIESADDEILRTIKKGTTVKLNEDAIKLLHDANVKVKCALICGLPGESTLSLTRMSAFCANMQPYVADFDFTILQVYPGSHIWRNPELYDLTWQKGGWYKGSPDSYGETSPISTSNLSFMEIVDWRRQLERAFKPERKLR